MSIEERFWSKVWVTDTCYLWSGAINGSGYGHFNIDSQMVYAHRFAYELAYGKTLYLLKFDGKIPEGLYCLHHCDNPPCVNAEHLFLGTALHNVLDAIEKGRFNKNPIGMFGKRHSEESKRKISKGLTCYWKEHSRIGQQNPMFGRHHSKETRRKMSEAGKRRYSIC